MDWQRETDRQKEADRREREKGEKDRERREKEAPGKKMRSLLFINKSHNAKEH